MASPRLPWSRKARRTGKGRGNRPEVRAGRESGKGLGPSRDSKRGSSKRLRPGKGLREIGEAFGLSRDPNRDFESLSGSRDSSKGEGFGRNPSKGRPERSRPRCEPSETARLRPGRIRRGSVRGPTAALRNPPGAERGFAASLRGPRKAKRAFAPASQSESRPARDGLATQRRQSKLGQVGAGGDTGPHYDSIGWSSPMATGPSQARRAGTPSIRARWPG
jgi:hypothetical protein